MSGFKLGKITVSGYKYASANPNSLDYEPAANIKSAKLPRKVDLRPLMTRVEDQKNANSCSANAIAGAYEYLIKKHLKKEIDVSRLFIYYNARWRTNDQNEDNGSVIQYGIESLGSFGACEEAIWPYDTTRVTRKPVKSAYEKAAMFKTLGTQHVPVELKTWRQCLAEGYPIIFGCALFASFDECNQNGGVVPMPNPRDVGRNEHGRHAMLCVGYSDVDQVFIVRNSWGSQWGVKGYCYMPYNYLMSAKLNGDDCWIIRSADNLPSPEDTWISDKKTILKKEVDFEINEYAPEAYDRIKIDFFEVEDDLEYSDEAPDTYIELSETVEVDFLEDDEDYSFEEDEEDEEEEEEYGEDEEDEDEEDEEDKEDEDEEEEEYEDEEEEEEEEGDDEEEDEEDEEEEDDEVEEDGEEEEYEDEEEEGEEEEGGEEEEEE